MNLIFQFTILKNEIADGGFIPSAIFHTERQGKTFSAFRPQSERE
jgi:hypothetical protein